MTHGRRHSIQEGLILMLLVLFMRVHNQFLKTRKTLLIFIPILFQNHLRVTIPGDYKVIFHLVNLLGEIVANESLVGSTLIDLTPLDPGLYIGEFTFPEGRMETHKIIKQ